MQTTEEKIEQAIEKPLAMKQIAVVQVRVIQGSKSKTLQILLENAQTGTITLDECADAARTISAILDVEECISGRYSLEVSSPGVDRPLIKEKDFAMYAGFEVIVESNLPVEGRRRFKGALLGVEDAMVQVKVDNQSYKIALNNIRQAKPVVTDALMKAHKDGLFSKQNTQETVH